MRTLKNPENLRYEIIDTYSRWTALSSTRSGSPLKSRKDIYSLLGEVDFKTILSESLQITKEQFNNWHKKNSIKLNNARPEMQIGWTTKLINVYLKTMVYVANLGPKELVSYIHPPIDNGLLNGLENAFKDDLTISQSINFKTLIKDIKSYEDYMKLIIAIEQIAAKEKCLLIEVEQFWEGTKYNNGIKNQTPD